MEEITIPIHKNNIGPATSSGKLNKLYKPNTKADIINIQNNITGEINYLNVFKHIHSKGYKDILGMEHGNSIKLLPLRVSNP